MLVSWGFVPFYHTPEPSPTHYLTHWRPHWQGERELWGSAAIIECLGSDVTWIFLSYLITYPQRDPKAHDSMCPEGGKPEILVNITNDHCVSNFSTHGSFSSSTRCTHLVLRFWHFLSLIHLFLARMRCKNNFSTLPPILLPFSLLNLQFPFSN